jgi:hypothetical protein
MKVTFKKKLMAHYVWETIQLRVFHVPFSYFHFYKLKRKKSFVVLYGHGSWSFTLMKKQRSHLRKRVTRRICGPMLREITGLQRLHYEELHNFHCSTYILIVIDQAG